MSSATWAPQYLGHIQGTHDRSKAEHVAHGPGEARLPAGWSCAGALPAPQQSRAAQDVHGQHDRHGVEPVRAAGQKAGARDPEVGSPVVGHRGRRIEAKSERL